jgi:Hg(II)-responsive transcriptional regulator
MKGLTRSQVAKASNVNIETIRYYERRGLISEPPRTESGYRMFSQEVIKDIQFIKRTQELGFTLEEIKKLLTTSHSDDEKFDSEEVYRFAISKVQEIETKIKDLTQMKAFLEDLAEKCPGSGIPKNECPILKNLTEGAM